MVEGGYTGETVESSGTWVSSLVPTQDATLARSIDSVRCSQRVIRTHIHASLQSVCENALVV